MGPILCLFGPYFIQLSCKAKYGFLFQFFIVKRGSSFNDLDKVFYRQPYHVKAIDCGFQINMLIFDFHNLYTSDIDDRDIFVT